MAYTHVVPKPVRTGLRNAFDNIGEVRVFANDMLQFRPKQAGWTLLRFATNTTFGVAGLFDVATGAGVPHHDNDFGLTLGRMDIDSGPYLFLPVMGPTTVRDLTGSVVDLAFNPLTWGDGDAVEIAQITGGVTKGLDLRARVDDDLRRFRDLSLEPYTAMRSAYLQNRRAEVVGGELSIEELPDFPELEGGPQEPSEQTPPPQGFPELDGGPQAPPVASQPPVQAASPPITQQHGTRR
jgi:phospholipid-binding lipoprotein MlaA